MYFSWNLKITKVWVSNNGNNYEKLLETGKMSVSVRDLHFVYLLISVY